MTLCPIAIVAGCQKCPAFRICPLKGLLGDKPPQPVPEVVVKAKRRPKPKASSRAKRDNKPRSAAAMKR